jgi:hypothetical protein
MKKVVLQEAFVNLFIDPFEGQSYQDVVDAHIGRLLVNA